MRKLMTEEQVADLLGFAPKTLANQRCRGEGPPFLKLGRLVRYDPEDVTLWISANRMQSTKVT